ncbi:MAG: MFS transporter [Prochlorococcus sp.]|nr:MFS transporter [Prochlorococcaceae cyanobacterium ETNP18_MAG_1]
MTEQTPKVQGPSVLFRHLWGGQLISNLGTQTSLYGIGLWLFAQSGDLLDFGLVAVVVQVARLLALPLLIQFLVTWPPGRLMLFCHSTGALCTGLLALLLLGRSSAALPPLVWIFAVQGLAAVAEGILVVRLSSLIPLLIAEEERLQRANGLFATVDGLVITVAPFLGSWLVAVWGLAGVLVLDGITFVLALLAVVIAPWHSEIQNLQRAVVSEQKPWAPRSTLRRGRQLWQRSWAARSALLLTGIAAFVYAALEVLFPAWVSLAYPPERMGAVLIVGTIGYLVGFAAWRSRLGRCWQSALLSALLIQALILMGSGLEAFAGRDGVWLGAVLVFSCGLPVVMAALHQAWVELAPRDALPRYFALRYGCEWSTRLVAFLSIPLFIDRLLSPAMSWSIWPLWLNEALGTGPGRVMAIAMGGLGWLIVIGLGLRGFWFRDRGRAKLGMGS